MNKLKKIYLFFIIIISGCESTSCCFQIESQSKETKKYIIIGLGIIKVESHNESQTQVTQIESLGALFSTQAENNFNLGYLNGTSVSIPIESKNSILEFNSSKNEGIRIKLQNKNQGEKICH